MYVVDIMQEEICICPDSNATLREAPLNLLLSEL